MITLFETSKVADEPIDDGVRYIIAAVMAMVAVLGLTAMFPHSTRVGDGSTNHLSSYVTGGNGYASQLIEDEAYPLGR